MMYDEACILMSTAEEYEKYCKMIVDMYPFLCNTFGTADGLKLHLEQGSDTVIQNLFYNGWKGDHYLSIVCLFMLSV